MSISVDQVTKIAKLSRLLFNDEEKQKLQHELSSILDYVDQLQKVQNADAGDMAYDPEAVNLMRNDVAEPTLDPEDFLAQAPDRQGNFVKVKSVL